MRKYALRLPGSLYEFIQREAAKQERSINSQIIVFIKKGIANKGTDGEAINRADELIAPQGQGVAE